MKVITLKNNFNTYSCNSYLILGEWSTIDDVNTLIDVGTDNFIIEELEQIYTGVGKNKIDKVLLTHNHFDHVAGLPEIKHLYNPEVFAFSMINNVDSKLYDGQLIHAGDSFVRAIHTPGHSSDSFCFYFEKEQILFAGDTQVNIKTPGGTYTEDFINSIEKISSLKIKKIYHGHDNPIENDAQDIIYQTLNNIKNSNIIFNHS